MVNREDIGRRNRIALFSIVLFLNTYFFQHYDNIPNPNEQSRIYLITAIVDNGKISIDEQIKRFGDTIDISTHNGKAYCDKAPGLSFLGVPLYFLLKQIGRVSHLDITYPIILKFLRTVLLSISQAFFVLLMFSVLRRFVGDFQLSLVLTLFYSIGTIAFTYSTLLFGHQLGSMLVFLLFYLVITSEERSPIWLFFSGFIAGYAVVVEYPLMIISTILSVYQFLRLKDKKRIMPYIIGGSAAAGILFVYNYSAFGSVLSTGYAHIANPAFAQFHREGLLGVTTPKLGAFIGSFFSTMRGIFYFMPALIFSLAGLFFMIKDRRHREIGVLISLIFGGMAYFISSFSYWQAGGTISQRHLCAIIPFLILPLGIFIRWLIENRLYSLLVIVSSFILLSMLIIPYATVPFPFFSTVYPNPIFELPLNLWRWGAIPINIANIFGFYGLSSTIPFLIIWIGAAAYTLFLLLSYLSDSRSPFVNSVIAVAVTFLLITSMSFVARDKNYEGKMKDVVGILENFNPSKNSCEYVLMGRSSRFKEETCLAFLRKTVEGIEYLRDKK